jgi:hypothetical protein
MKEAKAKIFNLESSAGEWFPFFESEVMADGEVKYSDPAKDAAKVKLRQADPDVLEDIYTQTGKEEVDRVLNPKSHTMDRVPFRKQTAEQKKLERELIWDYAIMDWEDRAPFLQADGSPIAKTVDNKLKLMGIGVFGRFVTKCLQSSTGMAELKEAERKNL